jgi:hypothetical protein
MKKIFFSLIFSLFLFSRSFAGLVETYQTYATNDTLTSLNLNGNFNNIRSVLNGGIDNANIDTVNGLRLYEILGTLPAAGTQGRTVFYTVDNSLNLDTGTTWKKTQASLNSSPGFALPSGAVFFMMTGSCPTGTTDVTATYSDKFIKVNATQGTTGGAATDSITLTTTELPSHQHALTGASAANESAHTHQEQGTDSDSKNPTGMQYVIIGGSQGVSTLKYVTSFAKDTAANLNTLGGSAHGHTLSGNADAAGTGSAFTVDTVPPFVTCRLCSVD